MAKNKRETSRSKLPLKGLMCFVETFNEDGSNASASYHAILTALGAEISNTLGEHVSHFIAANTSSKRIMAAEFMNVSVVSPLWVQQCRDSDSLAPEEDFLISSVTENSKPKKSPLKEPVRNKASAGRSIDSPFFSSSQREFEPEIEKPKRKQTKTTVSSVLPLSSAVPSGETKGTRSRKSSNENTTESSNQIIKTTATTSNTATNEPVVPIIPMPTFREYKPPSTVPNKLKRRRSERLSDLAESEDELFSGGEQSADEEPGETESDVNDIKRIRKQKEKIDKYISQHSQLSQQQKQQQQQNNNRSNNDNNIRSGKVAVLKVVTDDRETPSLEQVLRISDEEQLPIVFYGGKTNTTADTTSSSKNGASVKKSGNKNTSKTTKKTTTSNNNGEDSNGDGGNSTSDELYPKLDAAVAALKLAKQQSNQQNKQQSKTKTSSKPVTTTTVDNKSSKAKSTAVQKKKGKASAAVAADSNSGSSGSENDYFSERELVPASRALKNTNKNKKAKTVGDDDETTASSNSELQIEQPITASRSLTMDSATAAVVIALTGFDDKQGDVSTLTRAIGDFVGGMRKRNNTNSSNSSSSSSSSSKNTTTTVLVGISPLETSVSLLTDHEDFSADSCTHVIVNNKHRTRTLRILFAIAHGWWILTEDWLWQSVCEEKWADCRQYRVPRYKNLQTGRASEAFRNKAFFVLRSVNPAVSTIEQLIAAAQGVVKSKLVDSTEEEPDYIVFGDADDVRSWLLETAGNKSGIHSKRKFGSKSGITSCSSSEVVLHDARRLVERFVVLRKVVTNKYLFNCLEEGRLRTPSKRPQDGEVITQLDDNIATATATIAVFESGAGVVAKSRVKGGVVVGKNTTKSTTTNTATIATSVATTATAKPWVVSTASAAAGDGTATAAKKSKQSTTTAPATSTTTAVTTKSNSKSRSITVQQGVVSVSSPVYDMTILYNNDDNIEHNNNNDNNDNNHDENDNNNNNSNQQLPTTTVDNNMLDTPDTFVHRSVIKSVNSNRKSVGKVSANKATPTTKTTSANSSSNSSSAAASLKRKASVTVDVEDDEEYFSDGHNNSNINGNNMSNNNRAGKRINNNSSDIANAASAASVSAVKESVTKSTTAKSKAVPTLSAVDLLSPIVKQPIRTTTRGTHNNKTDNTNSSTHNNNNDDNGGEDVQFSQNTMNISLSQAYFEDDNTTTATTVLSPIVATVPGTGRGRRSTSNVNQNSAQNNSAVKNTASSKATNKSANTTVITSPTAALLPRNKFEVVVDGDTFEETCEDDTFLGEELPEIHPVQPPRTSNTQTAVSSLLMLASPDLTSKRGSGSSNSSSNVFSPTNSKRNTRASPGVVTFAAEPTNSSAISAVTRGKKQTFTDPYSSVSFDTTTNSSNNNNNNNNSSGSIKSTNNKSKKSINSTASAVNVRTVTEEEDRAEDDIYTSALKRTATTAATAATTATTTVAAVTAATPIKYGRLNNSNNSGTSNSNSNSAGRTSLNVPQFIPSFVNDILISDDNKNNNSSTNKTKNPTTLHKSPVSSHKNTASAAASSSVTRTYSYEDEIEDSDDDIYQITKNNINNLNNTNTNNNTNNSISTSRGSNNINNNNSNNNSSASRAQSKNTISSSTPVTGHITAPKPSPSLFFTASSVGSNSGGLHNLSRVSDVPTVLDDIDGPEGSADFSDYTFTHTGSSSSGQLGYTGERPVDNKKSPASAKKSAVQRPSPVPKPPAIVNNSIKTTATGKSSTTVQAIAYSNSSASTNNKKKDSWESDNDDILDSDSSGGYSPVATGLKRKATTSAAGGGRLIRRK